MTRFNPSSWRQAADILDVAAEELAATAQPAIESTPPPVTDAVADRVVGARCATLQTGWFRILGGLRIKLGSDASKMRATAENYSNAEDINVEITERYWDR